MIALVDEEVVVNIKKKVSQDEMYKIINEKYPDCKTWRKLKSYSEITPDISENDCMDLVLKVVSKHADMKPEIIRDFDAFRGVENIVRIRQIAMYLMMDIYYISTVKVGKYFFKHHSTAIYARSKVQDKIDTNWNGEFERGIVYRESHKELSQ